MERPNYALVVATLFALLLLSQAATAALLTREQVRADLIAAELSGKFPQNKRNKPDHAMFYAAKKATEKAEKDLSRVPASGNMTAAGASSASPPSLLLCER
jgi:hypothetical protein